MTRTRPRAQPGGQRRTGPGSCSTPCTRRRSATSTSRGVCGGCCGPTRSADSERLARHPDGDLIGELGFLLVEVFEREPAVVVRGVQVAKLVEQLGRAVPDDRRRRCSRLLLRAVVAPFALGPRLCRLGYLAVSFAKCAALCCHEH